MPFCDSSPSKLRQLVKGEGQKEARTGRTLGNTEIREQEEGEEPVKGTW